MHKAVKYELRIITYNILGIVTLTSLEDKSSPRISLKSSLNKMKEPLVETLSSGGQIDLCTFNRAIEQIKTPMHKKKVDLWHLRFVRIQSCNRIPYHNYGKQNKTSIKFMTEQSIEQ